MVSTGKPMALVPAFGSSTSYDQMVADLKRLGFHSSELTSYSNTVPAGDRPCDRPAPRRS